MYLTLVGYGADGHRSQLMRYGGQRWRTWLDDDELWHGMMVSNLYHFCVAHNNSYVEILRNEGITQTSELMETNYLMNRRAPDP